MVGDKCACCEWVMMAVYQPDDMCPEPHLVSVVECVVSAVLVEDAAGVGGAQVA